jgi:hypothetical protein
MNWWGGKGMSQGAENFFLKKLFLIIVHAILFYIGRGDEEK